MGVMGAHAQLPSLAGLSSLGVTGCTGFGPACLKHLRGFSRLTELALSFEQTDQMRALLQVRLGLWHA